MEWVIWLVTGFAAGILALFVIYRSVPSDVIGWVGALIVGLIGGVVGGWVAGLIGLESVNWLGSLIVAFLGAALVLWPLRRAGLRRT